MTREAARAWQVAGCVGLGLCLVYAATAQRGVSWQDSGEFQRRALMGDFAGVEGIARAHPLYVAALHLLTLLVPSCGRLWAMHAFSGLGMSVAAALCAWLVAILTRHALAAATAGLLLGLAHMSWWMATIAEVYTWSLALLLLEAALLNSLLSRPRPGTLCWLALTSGLGLSVHNTALLSGPVWALATLWLIRKRALPPWSLAPAAAAWLVGAAPFLALVVGAAGGPGGAPAAIRDALFAGIYRGQVLGLWPALPWSLVVANLALFSLSLASPLWLAAVVGWRQARRMPSRAFAVCLAAMTAAHFLFFIRYFVADQATFSLPTLGLLSIWVGVGMHALIVKRGWTARAAAAGVGVCLACPILVYGGGVLAVRAYGWQPARARALPFRDETRYWLLPWKRGEDSAARFARAVFSQSAGDDTIYADSTAAGPLAVAALTDPAIGSDRPALITYYDPWTREREPWTEFLARLGARPFYVVSPAPGYLPAGLTGRGATFTPTGVLYRVEFTLSEYPGHRPR